MPSWLIKAGLQGAMSLLPLSETINYFFQRHVTRGLRLTESIFEEKLAVSRRHLQHYQQAGKHSGDLPQTVIELGTGWQPIVPIALALSGADRVMCVDIQEHTRRSLLRETLDLFVDYQQSGRLARLISIQGSKVQALHQAHDASARETPARALRHLNIELMVADARRLPLDPGSVDLITSNNTLEHIPQDVLQGILAEFHRIAAADAVMSHLIDLSDHYSHFDPRISAYHFLQFAPATWRLFNNPLLYQNRLRVSDYRDLHDRAGFHIQSEDNQTGSRQPIESIRLADDMRHYHHDDLIVTHSWMVSTPQPHGQA